MRRLAIAAAIALLIGSTVTGCGGDGGNTTPGRTLQIAGGDGQSAAVNQPLPSPLSVSITESGNPVAGVAVTWAVVSGGGSIAPSSTTGSDGVASAVYTVGAAPGAQRVEASAAGVSGSPRGFSATAVPIGSLAVVGGGNNVSDRFSSDLWLHGSFAYTGTWGQRGTTFGDAVNVWELGAAGAPTLVRAVVIPSIETVSDVAVSPDGSLLVATAEGGTDAGLHIYSLANPAQPVFLAKSLVPSGLHTGTLALVAGKLYAFTARNPDTDPPALVIYDLSAPAAPAVVTTIPVPPNYGIHDTFVRDGLAFAFIWNTGLRIYDVGNGIRGGSVAQPALVGALAVSDNGVPGGPQVHNGWWFHNPNTSEKRYLFTGQEGPVALGSQASGDIHVVDVSDLANPVEVGFYRLDGAGSHNFWMDEANEILYAAYYNGGVVALDVSGTLSGDLATREVASVRPAGDGTFVWGVQLHNGSVYAIDMLSGLWQLAPSGF